MTDLLNIAKECGALPLPVSRNEQQYIFTEAQLHATVEQVCAPLVEALNNYRESEMNGLGAVFNTPAKEALEYYSALIGDKHE